MTSLLGIDFGLRRLGLAVSDPERRVAVPLGVHDLRRDGPFADRLPALVREREVGGIVVGLPLRADGGEGDMAARARGFADELARLTGLAVRLVDERYTSSEAAGRLRDGGGRRIAKGRIDAVSAQILLQSHLDSRRRGGGGEGPA